MPEKRGRPRSIPHSDPALQQRREQERVRQQTRRQRQRETLAAALQPTDEQDEQRNLILQRPFIEKDAPPTLAQLGLRVQGLILAQDPVDAQLQQQSIEVEDHYALYNTKIQSSTNPVNPSSADIPGPFTLQASRPPPLPSQRPVADFFTSHPTYPIFSPSRIDASSIFRAFSAVPPESRKPSFSPITDASPTSSLPLLSSYIASGRIEIDRADPLRYTDHAVDPFGTSTDEEQVEDYGGEQLESYPEKHLPIVEVEQNENAETQLHAVEEQQTEEEYEGQPHPVEEQSEDEFHDFPSEHSSGHSTPEPELSALEFTVEKLFEMMQEGFHGCSADEHAVQLQTHITGCADNHHGLDALFSDPAFPSVLSLPEYITTRRLPRQRAPSHRQWTDMFCGIPPHGPDRRPRQVCLHVEETQEVPPDIAFDIDSFLFFASSLAAARQGVHYQPAPQIQQNLQTDIHINTTVYETGDDPDLPPRPRAAILKDVPHFHLGRVEGASDISLYILFPHLSVTHAKLIGLTNEQLARWLDQVFHPAVYGQYSAHYTQHLPASHRHALANSKSRQVENRQAESASYQAQQYLHYFLQPDRLHDIWEEIIHTTTHTPGVQDFRDPQLFFSAKGTKLQFKTSPSRPTMLDTINNFQAYFERIIDLKYIFLDRFYVDLGKEICASVGLPPDVHGTIDDEAQVYLWRRCCLEHHLRWLYDGPPPKSGQTFYHTSMLRDACTLTSLTPKRSRLREGGLVYSQLYNSVKEMTDAAKSFPFQNEGLEELALDPQIRRSAHVAGGNTGRNNSTVIKKAYLASKRRTHFALTDSRHKSFGIREEHRVSWPLLLAFRRRLEREAPERLEITLVDCPIYVWPIRTAVYADFLRRNVDKFATGFEVALTRCAHGIVTWEQTKIMAMFLRGLRFALNSHEYSRESALWWSRREMGDPQSPRIWYGLGYANTMSRYGYAWIEPRIDFKRLVFHVNVTDHVLFGNQALCRQYLRRGGAVRDFHSNFVQLERAVTWLQRYHASATISDRLIDWIVHLCLRQFRVDTLTTVLAEIRPDHREAALDGLRTFSDLYLKEIMHGDGLHLVSGNKSAFKTPLALKEALFGYDDARKRAHWESKPYRTLYERVCVTLGVKPATAVFVPRLQRRLTRWLFAFHWILPYPNTAGFMQTNKDGRRVWYSIRPDEDAIASGADMQDIDPAGWEWAHKDWWPGHPPELPRYLRWPTGTWETWIKQDMGSLDPRTVSPPIPAPARSVVLRRSTRQGER